jgi:hypothetical protein
MILKVNLHYIIIDCELKGLFVGHHHFETVNFNQHIRQEHGPVGQAGMV